MGRYQPGSIHPEHTAAEGQRWLEQELHNISQEMRDGAEVVTHYNPQGSLPARPRLGDVAYFEAGVAGLLSGLYVFGKTGTWERVNTSAAPAEYWADTASQEITADPGVSSALVFQDPFGVGQTPLLFSEAGGVLTALAPFQATVELKATYGIAVTANNGYSQFTTFTEGTGVDAVVPIEEYMDSARVQAWDITRTSSGTAIFALGETISVRSFRHAGNTSNAIIDLDSLYLVFSNAVLLA